MLNLTGFVQQVQNSWTFYVDRGLVRDRHVIDSDSSRLWPPAWDLVKTDRWRSATHRGLPTFVDVCAAYERRGVILLNWTLGGGHPPSWFVTDVTTVGLSRSVVYSAVQQIWSQNETRVRSCVVAGGRFVGCERVSQRRTVVCMFDDVADPRRLYSSEFTAALPDNHVLYHILAWTEHLR